MKTTSKDCFSNGNEHLSWTARNCDRCWKHSRPKDNGGYTVFVCIIDKEINHQMLGENVSRRTYDITQMRDCPYRQEKRPVYKRGRKVYKQQLALEL